MKAFTQNIISLFFGLYFLVAGTGFNVVNYCCSICENEGVEAVIVESMHVMPHAEMSCCEKEMTTTCQATKHTNSCHLTRLSLEPTPISTAFELKKYFSFKIILFSDLQAKLFEACNFNNDFKYHLPPPEKALLLQGRDILTAKAVLLI